MRTIKINFVDYYGGFNPESNFIIDTLRAKYHVEISDNPDYLFFSCFGVIHLSYHHCVKIFFTGESLVPDFNVCDYALGFDWIEFGDRYLRLPLYQTWDSFAQFPRKKEYSEEQVLNRKFCSIVVSNTRSADPIRERFFRLLSEYKKVDSGGRAWNNIGGPVDNKLDFVGQYKFNIAFENNSAVGYTTEKIMEPMVVNSIPIYRGNPLISKDFNPRSFINTHDFKSLEDAVEYIVELDSSDEKYLNMLKQPWILDESIYEWREHLLRFLSTIIEKPLDEARYLSDYGIRERYVRNLKIADFFNNKMRVGRMISAYKRICKK